MRKFQHLEPALSLLESNKIKASIDVTGGCHLRIRWEVNGCKRQYFAARTPSDYRVQANIKSEVRRMLRQDGIAA